MPLPMPNRVKFLIKTDSIARSDNKPAQKRSERRVTLHVFLNANLNENNALFENGGILFYSHVFLELIS